MVELGDIERNVANANVAAAVGAPTDLGGVATRLVRLCAVAGRLPPAERPVVAETLARLLASFERLERAIAGVRLQARCEAAA